MWLRNKLVKHVIRFHAVHIAIFTVGLLKSEVIKQQMIYAAFNPDLSFQNCKFSKQNTGFLKHS